MLVIILANFLTLFAVASANSERANYGETCSATTRKCNKRAYLTCDLELNICKCSHPQAMIFDITKDSCLVKIGEQCKFNIEVDGRTGNEAHLKMPCVHNAHCPFEGFCACKPNYYETINDTCAPYGKYGDECGPLHPCNAQLGLNCNRNSGVCDCDSTVAFYSDSLERCAFKVGKLSFRKDFCLENAESTNGTCICSKGFYAQTPEKCSVQTAHGSNCTSDDQCGFDPTTQSKLVCLNGNCDCNPAKYSFVTVLRSFTGGVPILGLSLDQSTRSLCTPKPGHPCFKGHCAPPGECSQKYIYNDFWDRRSSSQRYEIPILESNSFGVCQCPRGSRLSNSTGLCSVGYGSSCDAEKPCLPPLVCFAGSECACPLSHEIYDPKTDTCQTAKLYGPCKFDSQCNIDFSRCQIVDGSGLCVCQEGYVPTAEDKCKVTHNGRCKYSQDCDRIANLQCINQRCRCHSFSIYSEERRQCLGLTGSRCDGDESCTANAICRTPYARFPRICTCPKGFKETNNYTCKAEAPTVSPFVAMSKEEMPILGNNYSWKLHLLELFSSIF